MLKSPKLTQCYSFASVIDNGVSIGYYPSIIQMVHMFQVLTSLMSPSNTKPTSVKSILWTPIFLSSGWTPRHSWNTPLTVQYLITRSRDSPMAAVSYFFPAKHLSTANFICKDIQMLKVVVQIILTAMNLQEAP